jgi:hypothetical protein
MRATLPQATIDYCLNCLPPSSPIRHNISSLISFLHQLDVSFSFSHSPHPIIIFSLFSQSLLPLSSLLTCCHSSFLSFLFSLAVIPPSSPFYSNLLLIPSFLPSLFQLDISPSFLSSLFCLATSPFLPLLSFLVCYHPSFLSSLF